MVFTINNDLQNELVAWLPVDARGVHKPLRPIDVPEQQLPPQLFTDDLIHCWIISEKTGKVGATNGMDGIYLIDGLLQMPLKHMPLLEE